MVEVSSLLDLDIYTIAGKYTGRVSNVVLNMRLGTISKFQVKVSNNVTKENDDIINVLKKGFWIDPDDNNNEEDAKASFNVDYEKVKAIGDIILIDPQEIEKNNE